MTTHLQVHPFRMTCLHALWAYSDGIKCEQCCSVYENRRAVVAGLANPPVVIEAHQTGIVEPVLDLEGEVDALFTVAEIDMYNVLTKLEQVLLWRPTVRPQKTSPSRSSLLSGG